MTAGPYYPPNWEELRQQQFELDRHTCKGCGINRQQLADYGIGHLECHHINTGPPDYFHPGGREVVGVNLITLCNRCHAAITNSVREQTNLLAPRRRVDITVTDQSPQQQREAAERPAVQIQVTDDRPASKRESAARRIEINLFTE